MQEWRGSIGLAPAACIITHSISLDTTLYAYRAIHLLMHEFITPPLPWLGLLLKVSELVMNSVTIYDDLLQSGMSYAYYF
jgi:hypothetical protein